MTEHIAARSRFSLFARPFQLMRRFREERRGAVAVEFGFVALPFFALVFAIIEVSFLFITGQAFDSSVDASARELMTGQAQSSSGSTAINSMATFMQYSLCPKLPAIITCSDVRVNVATISSFTAANFGVPVSNGVLDTSSWGYAPCSSGQIMKVEAVYPVAAITSFWTSSSTASISGVKKRVLYTSSVFECEPF